MHCDTRHHISDDFDAVYSANLSSLYRKLPPDILSNKDSKYHGIQEFSRIMSDDNYNNLKVQQ
jgi:hypothetical protein